MITERGTGIGKTISSAQSMVKRMLINDATVRKWTYAAA